MKLKKFKKSHFFFLSLIAILFASILLAETFILNHKQNWQYYIQNGVGKKLTIDNQAIYFIDSKGVIHSLNKNTGEANWLLHLQDHSPLEITQDEKFLYIACFNSHIYKVKKETGYISWSFTIPNQFWPDTEVLVDSKKEMVFFADRAGILYALNRNDGAEIWKNEFGTIDNTKPFVDKSIHFGFIELENDIIIADHFPSKTTYYINKDSGEIVKSEESSLKIRELESNELFSFKENTITINNNIINQPIINFLDRNSSVIWSYRTETRIDEKQVYQDESRLYYLNSNKTLLTSILINDIDPNKRRFKKVNFTTNYNSVASDPHTQSDPNQFSRYILKPKNTQLWIKENISNFFYSIRNSKTKYEYQISENVNQNTIEIDILHDQNHYNNFFTDVVITTTFWKEDDKEPIVVKGFYYNHNIWKVRAKLDEGQWQWEMKIRSKAVVKIFKGEVVVSKKQSSPIKVIDGNFVQDNLLLFPIGIQDTFFDESRDGNFLNKFGYAKELAPTNSANGSFTDFSDYLDLHQKEAGINFFRYGPNNWAPSIWKDLSSLDNFAMNIKGNLQGDKIIHEAKSRNQAVMMSVFAFFPPYSSKEAILDKSNQKIISQYLDYVIARYASVVDIWELTNEAKPSIQWLNFVSEYIYENDPYKNPITTNLEEPDLQHSDLLSIHLYFDPFNNFHLVNTYQEVISNQDKNKAKIISEFGFYSSNHFSHSADWIRKISWISALQNIGIIFWNTPTTLFQNPPNSNVYLGPQERQYLLILSKNLPKMEVDSVSHFSFLQEGVAMHSLTNNNAQVYYLLNMKEDLYPAKSATIPISISSNKTAQFIDPKTGIILSTKKVNAFDDHVVAPKFQDDLVLIIE